MNEIQQSDMSATNYPTAVPNSSHAVTEQCLDSMAGTARTTLAPVPMADINGMTKSGGYMTSVPDMSSAYRIPMATTTSQSNTSGWINYNQLANAVSTQQSSNLPPVSEVRTTTIARLPYIDLQPVPYRQLPPVSDGAMSQTYYIMPPLPIHSKSTDAMEITSQDLRNAGLDVSIPQMACADNMHKMTTLTTLQPDIPLTHQQQLEFESVYANFAYHKTATSQSGYLSNALRPQAVSVESAQLQCNASTSLVETVACFKCKLCTFISLSNEEVNAHVMTHTLPPPPPPPSHPATMAEFKKEMEAYYQQQPPAYNAGRSKQKTCNPVKNKMADKQPNKDEYICGTCQTSYTSLELCSAHMAKDHGMKFDKVRLKKINEPELAPQPALVADCRTIEPESIDLVTEGLDELQEEPHEVEIPEPPCDAPEAVVVNQEAVAKNVEIDGMASKEKQVVVKRGRPKKVHTFAGTNGAVVKDAAKNKENGGNVVFKCHVKGCNVSLRSLQNLNYHTTSHCDGFAALFCPECKQRYESWKPLSVHLWRAHLIDMELYTCETCNYKTYSYSKLMNVHVRIHGDDRSFLCDLCGKGFKTAKQMRNHRTIHTHKTRRRSVYSGQCELCLRVFTDRRVLRVHMDTVHSKLRPFLCSYCGYSGSSRSSLKMHIRQHTGDKPFSCDKCQYKTADHNSLRRHKMRHSGKKPYCCPFCTYSCIQASTYTSHLRAKHPGKATGLLFECGFCSFKTIKKDNFTTHMAGHNVETGVKWTRVSAPVDAKARKPAVVVELKVVEPAVERMAETVVLENGDMPQGLNNINEDSHRFPILSGRLKENYPAAPVQALEMARPSNATNFSVISSPIGDVQVAHRPSLQTLKEANVTTVPEVVTIADDIMVLTTGTKARKAPVRKKEPLAKKPTAPLVVNSATA